MHYQAPEMVTGGAYRGAAADAWSLGVIGYYCLCGRLPFVANNPVTLVRRIVRLSCRPLPPHISEGAADLLFGALLVANAAHRPPLVTLLHHRGFDMEALFVSVHRHPPRIAILPATIKQLAAAGAAPPPPPPPNFLSFSSPSAMTSWMVLPSNSETIGNQ